VSALKVPIRRLPHAADLPLPSPATTDSVGVDLLAAVDEPIVLVPGQRAVVPTGVAIALPRGYDAQVRARSGLAVRHGVMLLNAPGTIDPDYRGEIGVILANLGSDPFTVERGMRIAQLVVTPVAAVTWEETDRLPPTPRGAGGFGSTGTDGRK
jgi:dUTP pyrophosphatase